jgi:branched-chain amino acid transport system substrate-binding protein
MILLAAVLLASGCASSGGEAPAASGDVGGSSEAAGGPLVLGALLPLTGDLEFLGPVAQAAAQLAVDDVNAAGGVLGERIELRVTDSAEGAGLAAVAGSAEALLAEGAAVVVGERHHSVDQPDRDPTSPRPIPPPEMK